MEWDDLKHFLAVARTGSLTEAARGLKASAATVGRHIEALEHRLGARLFEHRSTGYVLTEVGLSILARAEGVETAVLAVERGAVSADESLAGKVRVACTEDMATMVIVPHLAPFVARYPGVALELVGGMPAVSLTRRDADIALRSVRPEAGDLTMRRIGGVDLAVYASRAYAQSRGLQPGTLDFAKVETITWIDEMMGLRGGAWLASHSVGSRVALRVNNTRMLYAACVAGLGVAVLPCFGGDADPSLVCIVPPQEVQTLDLWMVVHRDLATMPRVRATMDYLVTLGPLFSRQNIRGDTAWS